MTLEIHFYDNYRETTKFFSISIVKDDKRSTEYVSVSNKRGKGCMFLLDRDNDNNTEKKRLFMQYSVKDQCKSYRGIETLHKWQLKWLLRECNWIDMCWYVQYTIESMEKRGQSHVDFDHIKGNLKEMIYSKGAICTKKDVYQFYTRICEAAPDPNRDTVTMKREHGQRSAVPHHKDNIECERSAVPRYRDNVERSGHERSERSGYERSAVPHYRVKVDSK